MACPCLQHLRFAVPVEMDKWKLRVARHICRDKTGCPGQVRTVLSVKSQPPKSLSVSFSHAWFWVGTNLVGRIRIG